VTHSAKTSAYINSYTVKSEWRKITVHWNIWKPRRTKTNLKKSPPGRNYY
jgi:hypothetical protein